MYANLQHQEMSQLEKLKEKNVQMSSAMKFTYNQYHSFITNGKHTPVRKFNTIADTDAKLLGKQYNLLEQYFNQDICSWSMYIAGTLLLNTVTLMSFIGYCQYFLEWNPIEINN